MIELSATLWFSAGAFIFALVLQRALKAHGSTFLFLARVNTLFWLVALILNLPNPKRIPEDGDGMPLKMIKLTVQSYIDTVGVPPEKLDDIFVTSTTSQGEYTPLTEKIDFGDAFLSRLDYQHDGTNFTLVLREPGRADSSNPTR